MTDVKQISFIVPEQHAGKRIDAALAEQPELGLSRSRIKQLITEGKVLLNGRPVRPSCRLAGGEQITVLIPPPEEWKVVAEDIPVPIVYEDSDVIVIDKPRGMVVHPAAGHKRGTLVNALLAHSPDIAGIGGTLRPGLVHRLDRDTSGLMVVAKNEHAMASLVSQMKERRILKEYLAIVVGHPQPRSGTISLPIARHPIHRKKIAVTAKGREAITHYQVECVRGGYALLRLRLETGRTHQIRVHLAHVGWPIVGDSLYGGKASRLFDGGQALHSTRLAFEHPTRGEYIEFERPLPPELQDLWDRFG